MRRLLPIVLLLCSHSLLANFPANDLILPAVGRVAGAGGSQFYTTVWVTNPSSSSPADVRIEFLLAGQANLNPAAFSETIPPGTTKTYDTIAETIFGIKGLLGAARYRSSAPLLVSSRIYQKSDGDTEAQSMGAFYSAVPSEFGGAAGAHRTERPDVARNLECRQCLRRE